MGNVHLVTGYKGEAHVTAADQGAFNAAVFGDGQYVLERGNQLAASATTNNNIRVLDGEIMMQGRHIRINPDEYVDLTINNGAQDMYRNDLIVARYTRTASTGVEDCNLVVIEGAASDSAASDPAYTSGDILGGNALQNDMPLYRVSIDGINISAVTKLFTTIGGIDSDIPSSKLPTVPISKGGTGATTASTALANLGAAPAGLISATYSVASDAEIDAALDTELNRMSASTARFIKLTVTADSLSLPGGGNEVFIFKNTDKYAFVRATRYSNCKLYIRERSKSGGTWLSWYNPNDYTMEYGEREQIPSGANLNDYTSIGNYAVSQSSIATGISNCPTTNAFILNVFSSIGDDTKTPASGSTGYFYYIQELIDINANRWIRYCNYLGSYWTYGNWAKIITSAGGTITGSLAVTDDIKLQKTISGKTYLSRIYDNPDSGVYSAFGRYVDGELKNYIALYDDYTIIRTPLKLTAAHYGSTLPSTGVAGQLFFKI